MTVLEVGQQPRVGRVPPQQPRRCLLERQAERPRGVEPVGDPTATPAVETGVMVFQLSFERSVTESTPPGLHAVMRESFDALSDVAARR